jgi:hypothetical protein
MQIKVDPELPIEEVQLRAVLKVDDAAWLPKLEGVRVDDVSIHWPVSLLREKLYAGAKQFLRDMRKRGYEPVDKQILVWGPFEGKRWELADDSASTPFDRYDPQAGKDYLLIAYFRKRAVLTEIWTPEEAIP